MGGGTEGVDDLLIVRTLPTCPLPTGPRPTTPVSDDRRPVLVSVYRRGEEHQERLRRAPTPVGPLGVLLRS